MGGFVEVLFDVLCYSSDVLQRGRDEVDRGDVGKRRSSRMQLSEGGWGQLNESISGGEGVHM